MYNRIVEYLIAIDIPQECILELQQDFSFKLNLEETYFLSKIHHDYWPIGLEWKHHLRDPFHRHYGHGRYSKMIDRCYVSTWKEWRSCGGNEIKVCDAWHRLNPSGGYNYCMWLDHTLSNSIFKQDDAWRVDRYDQDDHYCPRNCYIASKKAECQTKQVFQLTYEDVVLARDVLGAYKDPYKRREMFAKMCDKLNCHPYILKQAVTGLTWTNVNETSLPVEV